MKAIIEIKNNADFKAVTSRSFSNPNFSFSTSQVKSINGIEIKTNLEVTAKHVSHYVGGGCSEFFKAPFLVELK